ncbi:OLC1v1015530C1 [Oldenlandia corymbosa var. corymbosa]|uniref:OLC1v1015530C1 n=1 Tax=Oldenlandia corymbosa var. corymbosa TaxID=529605 RepID=A0AAV1E5U1_OLDCO|nr:OLC1v1015530C1 [Oldenlandia corymbosa var. corymbosa]
MMNNGHNYRIIMYLWLLSCLLIHHGVEGNGNVVAAAKWLRDPDLSVAKPAEASLMDNDSTQYNFMSSKVEKVIAKKKKIKPAPPPPRTNIPGHVFLSPPPPRQPKPPPPPPLATPPSRLHRRLIIARVAVEM